MAVLGWLPSAHKEHNPFAGQNFIGLWMKYFGFCTAVFFIAAHSNQIQGMRSIFPHAPLLCEPNRKIIHKHGEGKCFEDARPMPLWEDCRYSGENYYIIKYGKLLSFSTFTEKKRGNLFGSFWERAQVLLYAFSRIPFRNWRQHKL